MTKKWCLSLGAPLIKLKGKIPDEHNWPKLVARAYDLSEFEKHNIGIVCGKEYSPGKYLHVVDIDPRNGGFETLKILCEDFDFDPKETLTVETGSGGHHYYYWNSFPIKKTVLASGVDFLGLGAQVVGPGSIHPTTKQEYKIISGDIQHLPKKLVDHLTKNEDMFFEGKTLLREMPEGGKYHLTSRDEYIFKMSALFRGAGMDYIEIVAALKIINEAKCKPPLPHKVIEDKAKRAVEKYLPNDSAVVVETTAPKKTTNARKVEDYLAESKFDYYENSDGAIHTLLIQAKECPERSYDEWNLASSLAIVSAAAQGSYYYPDSTRTTLNLYQWLAGPSGCGKDFYKRFVTDYITMIHEKLLASKFGSAYGLRASLYAFNSRISVIDEMQDEMSRLGSQKGSYLYQILTDMKELFNSGKAYHGTVIKDRFYQTVQSPRYSVFCLSVLDGIRNLLNAENVGGGLASRFMFYPINEIPDHKIGKRYEIDLGVVDRLKAIFEAGKSTDCDFNDHNELLKLYGGEGKGNDKTAPEHKAQTLSHLAIEVSKDASEMFQAFQNDVKCLYRDIFNEDINDSASAAPTIERSAMFAKKISSLHALGCGRETILGDDMVFGINVARHVTARFIEFMKLNTSGCETQKERNKVLRIIERLENASKSDLIRFAHMSGWHVEKVLLDLFESGQIKATQNGAPVGVIDSKKWPRGLVFQINRG